MTPDSRGQRVPEGVHGLENGPVGALRLRATA
jgi:hypothetical protein